MRRMTIIAVATMLATASAYGQNAGTAGQGPASAPAPAKQVPAAPSTAAAVPAHAAPPAKPAAAAASTPELRSAAALALSHEPTYDEDTAQRIREAALSYSDLAARGGWPALPADAKFPAGVPGPNADLPRNPLLLTCHP